MIPLTTEEEARFTKNLSNVEGTEKDSVKLICEVSKPNADVSWFRGDDELPEGGRYDHIVDGKRRILLIQDLKMADAGEYNCRLSPAVKTSGNLTINGMEKLLLLKKAQKDLISDGVYYFSELAAEFISKPWSQEVVEGEKAVFSCTVSKETYEVKWMKGDKELEDGDKYQLVSDGKKRTLIIKSCELKDEGEYAVIIGTTKARADLKVLGKAPIYYYTFDDSP